MNNFQGNTTEIVAASLGFILPVVSLFIVVKYLAPSFNNKLALINSSASTEPEQKQERFRKKDSLILFF